MKEPGSTDKEQPDQVLPYRNGSEDAPGPAKFYVMLIGGLVNGFAAVAVCGCAWVIGDLRIGGPTAPGTPGHQLNWEGPLCVTVLIVAYLAFIAIRAHWTHNRGLLLGLLVGVGISALLEGLCFAR